jgi:uncharacterized protein (DUF1330 family)
MAVYVIVEIADVLDEPAYAAYRTRVDSSVADAGGAYLARGGRVDVLEGAWQPNRIVLVRFDTAEAARSWWAGEAYAPFKAIRQRATKTNMILVEGAGDAR